MYPVLVDLGFFQLRSYGLLVAAAVMIGVWMATREARRRGLDANAVGDVATTAVLAGLVGARVYYVALNQPLQYLTHPLELLAVWHGGLAVHGALVAGAVAVAWQVRRRALPFWRLADAVAPGLALGQAIGQVACLLSGDSYGRPTALPWAITFTDPRALAPLGAPLHPVQVYELLAYLLVFVLTWRMARRPGRDGAVILAYALAYGVARFGVEFFRGDPPMIGGVVVPQAASLALVVGALGAWWWRRSVGAPTTARA